MVARIGEDLVTVAGRLFYSDDVVAAYRIINEYQLVHPATAKVLLDAMDKDIARAGRHDIEERLPRRY